MAIRRRVAIPRRDYRPSRYLLPPILPPSTWFPKEDRPMINRPITLAVFLAFPLAACANGHWDRDGDFGKKVAGSYLVEEEEWPTGSSDTLSGEGLVTFGADGTFLGEFTLDFGADHPSRFKSGKHGTWRQTGPRELTLTLLGFDYGQEEDNPAPVFGPENRVTGTIRIINTISFDEDFEKFSEEGSVEIFLAVDRADPLDPNAKPSIGPFRHSATGRRIRAPL